MSSCFDSEKYTVLISILVHKLVMAAVGDKRKVEEEEEEEQGAAKCVKTEEEKKMVDIFVKAAHIARVCLANSCMESLPCLHDALVILKNGDSYTTRLDAQELLHLCDEGLQITPFEKSHVEYVRTKKFEPVNPFICLSSESKLKVKIDPKDDETIAQYVEGWPCKASRQRQRLSLQLRLKALDDERNEVVKMLWTLESV
jgi:hypothetical protein